jgi:sugar phosphate isomerase/epimerase
LLTREKFTSLGIAHFSAISLQPADLIALAAAAGFARVGLRLWPPFAGAPHYPIPEGSRAARNLAVLLRDSAVQVYDIEAVVMDARFQVPLLEPIFAVGQELGAQRLTVAGDDPEPSRFVDNLADLCALAARYRMSIDVENMGWRCLATFSQAVGAVEATAKANCGVLVDALHYFRNGAAPGDVLYDGRSLVTSVQLCDAQGDPPRRPDEMILEARSGRCAPGQGSLPLIDLLEALPPDAVLSVEVPMVEGGRGPAEHIRHLFAATIALLDARRDVGQEGRAAGHRSNERTR